MYSDAVPAPEGDEHADSRPAVPPSAIVSERSLRKAQDFDLRVGNSASLNAAQVMQRYAAGTVLQAGPGIPNWHYNSYAYFWTGPVESSDTVRFLYVGPFVMGLWRLLGAATLVILFLWLAALSFGGNSRPHHPSRVTPADAAPAGEVPVAAAPANSTPTVATTGIIPVL